MTITRRSFFKLVAGAAALAAAPRMAWGGATIFCDGVSDDAPGVSALMRGEVVRFRDSALADRIGWHGDTLMLDGVFTIKTPIRLTGVSNATLKGGRWVGAPETSAIFTVASDCEGVTIANMVFDRPAGGSVFSVEYDNCHDDDWWKA